MPKLAINNISLSLDNIKQTIDFKIKYILAEDIIIGDNIRIFYSRYNWNTSTWESEQLVRSSYSYIVTKTQSRSYLNLTENFNTTIGGRYKFRIALYRNGVEITSVSSAFKTRLPNKQIQLKEYIDTSNKINKPYNVVLNKNLTEISWNFQLNFNDLPLKHFLITAFYSKTLSIQRTVANTNTSYIFNNLQPGYVRFYIQAVNVADDKSISVLVNNVPHKIENVTTIDLFDKSSWVNKITNVKLKNCLDAAADRWNNFIKFNAKTLNIIQSSYEFKSKYKDKFKGIRLYSINFDDNLDSYARCGPRAYINLGTYKSNTIDFILYIKSELLQYSNSYITQVLTHELGHALGIGTLWNSSNDAKFPYSLNGDNILYSDTQSAYNKFILNKYPAGTVFEDLLLEPFPTNPKYIPLNFNGIGAGTHWAHEFNTTNTLTKQYPPIEDDIMSYGNINYITPVSIKFLVDLGYEEKNPGTSEYDGVNTYSMQILSNENDPENISCGNTANNEDIIPVLAIDASYNNVIIYDENIDITNDTICSINLNKTFSMTDIPQRDDCTRQDYGIETINIPEDFNLPVLVTITGSCDDTLIVDGEIVEGGTMSQTISGCDIWSGPWEFEINSSSFTIGTADLVGINASYDLNITITQI